MEILADLGFEEITKRNGTRGPELRFCRAGGDNPSAMQFLLNTLKYKCYTTNEKGDLYSLVMQQKGCGFSTALSYVAKMAGIAQSELRGNKKLPFGGFYKHVKKESREPEYTMKTYDDSILTPYLWKPNLMFLRDGISFQTQEQHKIGYSLEDSRVTIPTWTLDGKLCGIMGRSNDPDCPHGERWIPIISCARSYTLYGFHQNYLAIQSKGIAVIGESEKFTMQLHSMGSGVGLATCGHSVSKVQARHIKGLLIPKIILAFDEGLEEDEVRAEGEKLLVNNQLFQNRVGYIWDESHDVLPRGSKASPSDFGKEKFLYLMKRKVRWLN